MSRRSAARSASSASSSFDSVSICVRIVARHAKPAPLPRLIRSRAASTSVGSSSSTRCTAKMPASPTAPRAEALRTVSPSSASTAFSAWSRRRLSAAGVPDACSGGTMSASSRRTSVPTAMPGAAHTPASVFGSSVAPGACAMACGAGDFSRAGFSSTSPCASRSSSRSTASTACCACAPRPTSSTVAPSPAPRPSRPTTLAIDALRPSNSTSTVASNPRTASRARAAGRACSPPGCASTISRRTSFCAAAPACAACAAASPLPRSASNGVSPAVAKPLARSTTSNASEFAIAITDTSECAWRATASWSNSINSAPASTRAPASTCAMKPCPFSSTVSMPMCSSTSAPCGVVIVTAWPVRARCDTTPAHGATSRPASGSMPMPSPNIPPENTGSGTSASATIGPVNGLSRTI